jgi:REP element-mobilizing transposase RayT
MGEFFFVGANNIFIERMIFSLGRIIIRPYVIGENFLKGDIFQENNFLSGGRGIFIERMIFSVGANDYSPVRDWKIIYKRKNYLFRKYFFKFFRPLSYSYVRNIIEEFSMGYNPAFHHRRSIRLKGFDYSSSGAYFITLCVKNKSKVFGYIAGGKMILNAAGIAAHLCWQEIPLHYPFVTLDVFVIMPDHIHGIILINKFDKMPDVEFCMVSRTDCIRGSDNHSFKTPAPESKRPNGTSKTIGSVVRGYKIGVTKWLRRHTLVESVWQRDYYEHIIRNYDDLNRIRRYIINNLMKLR